MPETGAHYAMPVGRGRTPIADAWTAPADPDAVLAAMARPRRFCWALLFAPPRPDRRAAFFECAPVVGVLDDPLRLVTVRPGSAGGTVVAVCEPPLPPGVAVRVLRSGDWTAESIAASMLRDWQHGTLFSDPLKFDDLTR